jgi:hypothetical protein
MRQIYITCAGMRIPYDWTPRQLERALMLRKIKIDNEADVMEIFGKYLDMIKSLDEQIAAKQKELLRAGTF